MLNTKPHPSYAALSVLVRGQRGQEVNSRHRSEKLTSFFD
jgi:hypothetical protein